MCLKSVIINSVPFLNPDSIVVIIPVLNEEITIASVVHSLHRQGLRHIRVVDNGSRDRSAQLAAKAGAEVVYEPIPGYGRACWRGLQDMADSIQWVLFCDGDGSDDVESLPRFLTLAAAGGDLVLGDRTATPAGRAALTPVQRFGNALATTLIWWGWGYRYRDLGPLRLIRRVALESMQLRDRGFGWTVEIQVRAVECGLAIQELPVAYYPRRGGHSKISGTLRGSVRAGVIILSTLGQLYGRRLSRGFKVW
ncbi:MAG: glycosyltransferase family 2 protein [Leptolyngbyaceae cyanobacterium SM2_5_2]|nr:glycosyltransferase family 2 protein [Leptolyngbyaceae cyanobacterium SM2_5_2]